jgi:plastocyanin
MRHLIALTAAALLAAAGGCGQSPSPSAPTAVSATAAGTLDYYDDYPAPDPYPLPLPPPPEPPPLDPSVPGTLVVSPVYGATAGGTLVTITGGGFVTGTTVTFGATPAPATVVDPATLTVVAPPSTSGWVDVVVTIPGGGTLTLPGGFTYADEAASDATATITITPAGNTPKAVVVAAGGRVRFVNSDVRPHDLESDPHPMHSDCPEANGAGLLVPGASGMTGAFMTPRTCGIHDHNDPGNAAWMSRIVIR